MMKVTFDDYKKLYEDVPDEETFSRLYARAEVLLRGWTARRIDLVIDPPDYRYAQVKAAITHTIHQLAAAPAACGVTIVSNDGYSEHYASETDRMEALRNQVVVILSGTGLMGFV